MATSDRTTSLDLPHVLTPVLSDRFVARWSHVAITGAFTVLFLLLSYLPLFHAETWRHVAEGDLILQRGRLPSSPALMPLAEGMAYQNHGWLSQVLLALVQRVGGAEGLSIMQAVVQLSTLIVLSLTAYVVSRSKLLSLGVTALFLAVLWPELNVVRPAVLGRLALVTELGLLAHVVVSCRYRLAVWHWFAIPVLLGLWTNLDASFVFGVLVLGAAVIGRVVDLWQRTGRLSLVLADRRTGRLLWLFELSLAMTLLNPHGFALWGAFLSGSADSWWVELGGLRGFEALTWHGLSFVALTGATLVILRLSRRRLSTSSVIAIGLGSIVVLLNQSLVVFYVPWLFVCLLPHIRAIVQHRFGRWFSEAGSKSEGDAIGGDGMAEEAVPLKFSLSLICLLLVWIGFSLSPASRPLLGGTGRSAEQLFDHQTPLGVTTFLRQHSDRGLAWAPAYWGDWLTWSQTSCEMFAGSNAARLPQQVRHDYGRVFHGEGNWSGVLDRYGVETLIADKSTQSDLIDVASHGTSSWRRVYEDDQAVVFVRQASLSSQGGHG